MQTKICCNCKCEKELKDFYKDNRKSLGVMGRCKECHGLFNKNNIKRKEYKRNYEKKHKKENINYRIKCNLRTRIYKSLKGILKSKMTTMLLGCSIEEFKKYLERHFEKGMSWENYGKWHIDHYVPCAWFDLNKTQEQKLCFHWTNLRPLWSEINLQKNASLEVVTSEGIFKVT